MKKLLFLPLLILLGCTSLKTISSLAESDVQAAEASETQTVYPNYDSDSKILYQVSNDAGDLHLRLSTSYRLSMVKIAKTGLRIYFDPEGKKAKEIFVQYPLQREKKPLPEEKEANKGPQRFDLNELILDVPGDVEFHKGEKQETFNVLLSESDIKVSIKAKNEIHFDYHLTIPLKKIFGESEPPAAFTVGVVSGKIDVPPMKNNSASGSNNSITGGGLPGSNSSMAGSGMGGTAGMGAGPSGPPRTALAEPINFWFKVALKK
ncbi:MAG: hypothetical protein H6581_26820 [Bacteroidia bacterium]|nr:hypothetical protein [Bacteroidia bacterium]